ncbi:uncharacterized protein CANTADRAFT_23694 [Suhomyces tanzawaensis NRRL Y-17324]|uniref:Protein YOP1 n=1 Tax=Suhomyces tanzawaensis NRRL Y-17324 TaxID=984487 RepID=A0A1E4SDI4_9ASCO|nr:uncharacterized protein CANTADRAFT_23694 [Suhomyces tanzawaensis NRRL Y-17324]ODV77581.1 hypothetical protein CANTADRAFT_23694 [Suhomyces tanzawaensis NRRL Y-17324]
MVVLSLLTNLVSTVYPVIASYKAFDEYSKVANEIASSQFKIGGVTVPLNLVFKQAATEPGTEDRALQTSLITIQKWFIYWVVLATVQSAETFLFLRHLIPLYSLIKLSFSIWLLSPMVTFGSATPDTTKAFDNTEDWTKFSQNGCGLVYFSFIKPWIETKLVKFDVFPQKLFTDAKKLAGLGFSNTLIEQAVKSSQQGPETGLGVSESGILDSSYVMVKDFTSKIGYAGEKPGEEEEVEGDGLKQRPQKKKGWLW